MKRNLIWICHGFASPNGKGQTDLLIPYFEEAAFDVHEADYGFRLFTILSNKRTAQRIADEMKREKSRWSETKIVALGHSNGCLIHKKAADLGAPIDQMVLLAPALDADTKIAKHVKRILVYYAPTDIATGLSKYLPWSEWGSMGNEGSTLDDPRFVNINRSKLEAPTYFHLDLFHPDKLPYLARHILANLEAAYS